MTAASRRGTLHEPCSYLLMCIAAASIGMSPPVLAAKKSERPWSGPTNNVVGITDSAFPSFMLGSGVMLSADKVITDCHIFDDAGRLEVRQRGSRSEASLVYADRKRDLCELKVAQPGRFHPAALRVRETQDLDPGETVYAVAASRGEAKIVKGRVVRVTQENGDELVLISSRLTVDHSGGALFDRSGALIGVVTHRERATHKLSYAYPARYVLQRTNGEAASRPAADKAQTGAEGTSFRSVAEDYLNRLADASRAGVKYPEEARSQGWSGTASIRFDVEPGGELRQSFVDVSSGYAGLDVSALLAVRKALEELPMPDAVKEKGLKGTVAITFMPSGGAERRD
jgi:TonB family protein